MVEVQAFEVDDSGHFVPFDNGAPSRTAGTIHAISMSGVGDTHTLVPGWVRVVGDYSPTPSETQKNLPDGTQILELKPATGEPGEYIYIDPTMYVWREGMLEDIMRGKAEELAQLLRNSAAIGDFEI